MSRQPKLPAVNASAEFVRTSAGLASAVRVGSNHKALDGYALFVTAGTSRRGRARCQQLLQPRVLCRGFFSGWGCRGRGRGRSLFPEGKEVLAA